MSIVVTLAYTQCRELMKFVGKLLTENSLLYMLTLNKWETTTYVHTACFKVHFEQGLPFHVLLPYSLVFIWSFPDLKRNVFGLVLVTFNHEYRNFLLMRVNSDVSLELLLLRGSRAGQSHLLHSICSSIILIFCTKFLL